MITTIVPSTIDPSFTPQLETNIVRGTTAYLARRTDYIGPVLGANPDTIRWRITIGASENLSADMVHIDEVGVLDDPNPATVATYHYPLAAVGGNLIVTGSCPVADTHGACVPDAFSLDLNDTFSNADKIVFNPTAPFGPYTITYELVNTNGGAVVETHVYNVTVGPIPTTRRSRSDAVENDDLNWTTLFGVAGIGSPQWTHIRAIVASGVSAYGTPLSSNEIDQFALKLMRSMEATAKKLGHAAVVKVNYPVVSNTLVAIVPV